MPKHTIKWDANYPRIGTAVIEKAVCKGCSRNIDCLVMDSSEGEYGVGALCKNCINMLFEFPETKMLEVAVTDKSYMQEFQDARYSDRPCKREF